jgi:hypothetical protein
MNMGSWRGDRLLHRLFLWVLSVPPDICWDITLHLAEAASFHFILNALITNMKHCFEEKGRFIVIRIMFMYLCSSIRYS